MEGRAVGVVERFEGGSGFVAGIVGRDVGVEDLDGFVVEGTVGRVVGVDDLETVVRGFLEGDGLLIVALEGLMEDDGSLGAILVVGILLALGFASYNAIKKT